MEQFNNNNENEWSPSNPVYGTPVVKEGKKKKSFGKGIIVGVLVTVLVFVIGGLVAFSMLGKNTNLFSKATRTKLMMINQLLDKYYYDDIDDSDKIEGLYKGLVESANDPYTVYYTKDEFEDFQISTTGNYAGIGAVLQKNLTTGTVIINKVYEGSPAEKAGLRKDDEILYADDNDATKYDLDEFVEFIRGEAGTDVTIKYVRNGNEKTTVVTRDTITIPSVSYEMLDGNIGYIEITEFANNTETEFMNAINDLKSQGMEAVIFDLRSNGGGLVDTATAMLDDILPAGTTVYTVDKKGNRTDYSSDQENQLKIPTVVLISGYTASASEIFTGAVRDFTWGTIIGTKTYGKGVVQITVPLSDGSAVKVTTETYYTPKGDEIQGKGIEPDIELEYEFLGGEEDEYSLDLDNQVQKAVEVLNGQLNR